MDVETIDRRNLETIARISSARAETVEVDLPESRCECKGLGVILGTATEDSYGEPCPRGCKIKIPGDRMEEIAFMRIHSDVRLAKLMRNKAA